jgi:hypothetical protein
VVFEWSFERNGKSQKISVDGRVMVNNPDLALRAAVDGLGIAYMIEAYAEPFLRSGQLVRVLEDWSPTIEGLFLYYPGRRQVPAALRALIDMIRTSSSRPAKSSLQEPVRGALGLILPAPSEVSLNYRKRLRHQARGCPHRKRLEVRIPSAPPAPDQLSFCKY